MDARYYSGSDDRDTLGRNHADDAPAPKPTLGWCRDCTSAGVLTPATETWDFGYGSRIPLCMVHFKYRDNFEPTDAQREAKAASIAERQGW